MIGSDCAPASSGERSGVAGFNLAATGIKALAVATWQSRLQQRQSPGCPRHARGAGSCPVGNAEPQLGRHTLEAGAAELGLGVPGAGSLLVGAIRRRRSRRGHLAPATGRPAGACKCRACSAWTSARAAEQASSSPVNDQATRNSPSRASASAKVNASMPLASGKLRLPP